MAQNNNIKEFYKAEIEPLGSFGSEQEFTEFISDPKNATDFFEAEFKDKGIFGSSDEFVDFIGVKKKASTEPIQPDLGSGGTVGASGVQSTESKKIPSPVSLIAQMQEKAIKDSGEQTKQEIKASNLTPVELRTISDRLVQSVNTAKQKQFPLEIPDPELKTKAIPQPKDELLSKFNQDAIAGVEDNVKLILKEDPKLQDKTRKGFLSDAEQFEIVEKAISRNMINANNGIDILNARGINKIIESYAKDTEEVNKIGSELNIMASEMETLKKDNKINEFNKLVPQYNEKIKQYQQQSKSIEKYKEYEPQIKEYYGYIEQYNNGLKQLTEAKSKYPTLELAEKAQKVANTEFYESTFGKALDLGATATNSIVDAFKGLFTSGASIAADIGETLDPSLRKQYKPSDAFVDFMDRTITKPFLTKESIDSKFINPNTGNINWGVYPALKSVANNVGFTTMLALTGRATTPMLTRQFAASAPTLTASLNAANKAKVWTTVLPAYMGVYTQNSKEADEMGLTGAKKLAYVNIISGLEGVSELIMPDQDLIMPNLKQRLLKDFVKDYAKGKTFAVKNLVLGIAENAVKEQIEELMVMAGKNLTTAVYNIADGETKVYVPTVGEFVETMMVAGVIAGAMTAPTKLIENAQFRKVALYKMATNYEASKAILDQINPSNKQQILEEMQVFQTQIGKLPNDVSDIKKAEIALRLNEISEINKQNENPELSDTIKKVNEKRVSELEKEIYGIITDKEYDARYAEEMNKLATETISEDPITIEEDAETDGTDAKVTELEAELKQLASGTVTQEGEAGSVVGGEVEAKRIETEAKIKRKDLFTGVGEFSSSLGGSDKAAVPVSHKEKNGIEFVEYAHPETGSVDVIVTGKSNNDFVGFYRIYENGKPTNKWSSKFENQSRNKEDFKIMISGVQEMLPQGHEYTEKTSISTDGLRVWGQQLSRGYELQYDKNGKLITNLVAINGDAIVNELGIPVEKGQFENIRVKSKEEFEIVKKALLPYLEKLGLGENDIRWLTGTVKINLPVLKAVEELLTPKIEQNAKEQQSGQMREQSVQETTERTSDSDMPIVNETELQDRQAVEEEVTGREIQPNKQVSIAQGKAIKDVTTNLNTDLKDMEATMLFSKFRDNVDEQIEVGEGLTAKQFESLEKKGYVEQPSSFADEYVLTEKGKQFIDRVKARIETRRGVKLGTDMFPELANIPEFKPIQETIQKEIDNGTITEEAVEQYGNKTEPEIESNEAVVEDIERKAESDNEAELNEAITEVDKLIPPIEPPITITATENPKEVKKTVQTKRAYEGQFREEVKAEIEKYGLTREVENQELAEQRGKDFVNAVGVDAAFEAVKNGDISGAMAAAVLAEAMTINEGNALISVDDVEIARLNQKQAEIIALLEDIAVQGGRYNAMLKRIYQTSDLGFNAERKIQEYKALNNGEISPELEQKFRDLDAQLKDVNKRLAEAEQRAKQAEEKATIEAIKQAAQRDKEAKRTYKQRAKKVADEFRKLKTKPPTFTDANGNVIDITQLGIGWNELVEIGAKAIELSGELADGVKAISDKLKEQDWYAKLSVKDRDAILKQVEEYLSPQSFTEGDIKISTTLLKDLVEGGIDNINDLVIAVQEQIKDQYPNATERQIRDAITGYGKISSLSQDEIDTKLRKMRRLGKLISQLEDIREKKRPLRSGQQRDKLDAEERAKMKEVREAMKDLPMDEETAAKELKTYLDTVKQRLKNQIEDLNRQIQTGEKTPVSDRKVEYDDEVKSLIEERDRVKEIYYEIFVKPELTDEQRISIATKAIEKSITNLEEKLKTGDIFPKKKESKTPETPELKALREKREKLQEEIDSLRDASKVKKSPQEIATENAIKANKKSIEEKERRIKENDLSPSSKKEVADKNNAELKALREKNEALDKQLQKMRNDAKVKRDAAVVATEKAIKSLDKRTKEIEERIKKGELEKAKKASLVKKDTLEYKKAKKKLEEETDKLKKLQDVAGIPEKKRLEAAKKRTQNSINDLERRLREGDFEKKKPTRIIADDELTKLKAEKIRIKEEFDKEFYKVQLKNRTKFEQWKDRLWEAWNLPRMLMATGEFSFVLIQGLKLSLGNPQLAVKSFKNAMDFFKSEKKSEEWLRDVKSQPYYPIAKESKLALTDFNAELTAREELFYSGWTNWVWNNLGMVLLTPIKLRSQQAYEKAVSTWENFNPLKATERAAVGYLDMLRLQKFLDGMEKLEQQGKTIDTHKQDYKDVADVINTLTGRASIGRLDPVLMSKLFFSPRNWASGFKTATPYALYHFGKMTPTARKLALLEMSKFLGITTSMVALAAAYMNNDDDDETEVEFDPRSTDFMKLRIGNTRVDPWGGMQQQVVLSSRLIADAIMKGFAMYGAESPIKGAFKKDGSLYPLGVPFKTKTALELSGQQVINKLNPTMSLFYNYATTKQDKEGKLKDTYGNEYLLSEELKEKLYPIYIGTVSDLLKDDPSALDGLLSFYAFFGGGVAVYEDKKKQSTQQGSTLGRVIETTDRQATERQTNERQATSRQAE